MKKLVIIPAALLLFTGCVGVAELDPDVEVGTMSLKADLMGALVSLECANLFGGETTCSKYPNPLECTSLRISIKGDGRTCAVCLTEGGGTNEFCGGIPEGLPVACRASTSLGCHQCLDLYNNTMLDTCSRGASLYRAAETGAIGAGGAWLAEGPGETPPEETPPVTGGSTDRCSPENGQALYVDALNAIFTSEGLNGFYPGSGGVSWNPNQGFWAVKGKGKNEGAGDLCSHQFKGILEQCHGPAEKCGNCYCWTEKDKRTCKCGRMGIKALHQACAGIPADCDRASWAGAIAVEYGAATHWLFSGQTYPGEAGSPAYDGLPAPAGEAVKPQVACQGSPLVLDLAGDGVRPTSLAAGTRFDLMGHGAMRTAWIAGDDALLVLDRNGNGLIDDGTELFGNGTAVKGSPADNGFEALEPLDENGDGQIDAHDRIFTRLRLWRDADGDGTSQSSELATLAEAGVAALSTRGSAAGSVVDVHGNDLSLRGTFTRVDGGTGLMVDVFFGAKF